METFTDYKIKPLTLSEREDCSNRYFAMKNIFTQTMTWIRYGLIELKGIQITKDNFDIEVVKLDDDEIADIALDIREKTQFPNKKKS